MSGISTVAKTAAEVENESLGFTKLHIIEGVQFLTFYTIWGYTWKLTIFSAILYYLSHSLRRIRLSVSDCKNTECRCHLSKITGCSPITFTQIHTYITHVYERLKKSRNMLPNSGTKNTATVLFLSVCQTCKFEVNHDNVMWKYV